MGIYKRGKLGPVPYAWLERREQLAQAYAQARAALRAYNATMEVLDYGSGERWEPPAAHDPALATAGDPPPQAARDPPLATSPPGGAQRPTPRAGKW